MVLIFLDGWFEGIEKDVHCQKRVGHHSDRDYAPKPSSSRNGALILTELGAKAFV